MSTAPAGGNRETAIAPSGPLARAHGCRCDPLVNRGGNGYTGVALPGTDLTVRELLADAPGRVFIINSRCPVHCRRAGPEEETER